MICLHPVAMDEAEVKEMKDSLQQKVTATEVKVAIATAKKEIQDQFFRLTRALEGKVDQSFGDALSGAAREKERKKESRRRGQGSRSLYTGCSMWQFLPRQQIHHGQGVVGLRPSRPPAGRRPQGRRKKQTI